LQPFAGIATFMRCPHYDRGDITAILAANLAFGFLSLLARQKMAKPA
jgi:hypothetical protein